MKYQFDFDIVNVIDLEAIQPLQRKAKALYNEIFDGGAP